MRAYLSAVGRVNCSDRPPSYHTGRGVTTDVSATLPAIVVRTEKAQLCLFSLSLDNTAVFYEWFTSPTRPSGPGASGRARGAERGRRCFHGGGSWGMRGAGVHGSRTHRRRSKRRPDSFEGCGAHRDPTTPPSRPRALRACRIPKGPTRVKAWLGGCRSGVVG